MLQQPTRHKYPSSLIPTFHGLNNKNIGKPYSTRHILQFLIPEFLESASLVANQFSLRDRETRLLGDGHGIRPLGL